MPTHLMTAAIAVLSTTSWAQSIWRVDDDAPTGGDGLTWAAAFDDLQSALSAAQPGDQVWVADGRYLPRLASSASDPRTRIFELPHDVALYGAFAGFELSIAARAGSAAATLLDGDIGAPGVASDNCYHVVRLKGTTHFVSARLDRFTIRGGNALGGPGAPTRGGGVLVSAAGATHGPTLHLAECVIADNAADQGAGIACFNLAHVQLERCIVRDNHAAQSGGGAFVLTGLITSFNTLWRDNSAVGDGGACFLNSTTLEWVTFVGDVFHDNFAARGGAVALQGSSFTYGAGAFELCTFAYNAAAEAGAIFVRSGTTQTGRLRLENSVVWANSALLHAQLSPPTKRIVVVHSDVQGGYRGRGNLNLDPRFTAPALRDLRPLPFSAVIDAGDTTLTPLDVFDLDRDGVFNEFVSLDFAGQPRLSDDPHSKNAGVAWGPFGIVDMGAYER